MEMTFRQYIDNPLGVKGAVYSQRDMMKTMYTNKFDALFLREAGKIDFRLLYDKRKDEYYIHLKIPSEEIERFYYDVVIQFYTTNNIYRTENSLEDYSVRFYSNDPSFIFTYFNVFMKHDMLIRCLKGKAPKVAIKQSPDIRNPYQTPGYVKAIYFAYLFMRLKNLFFKQFYQMNGEKFTEAALATKVRHATEVIDERQELQKKKQAEKRAINKNLPKSVHSSSEKKYLTGPVQKTKRTETVKTSGKIKASSRSKSIKRK